MKRKVALIAACVAVLTITGCGGNQPVPEQTTQSVEAKGDAARGQRVFSKLLKQECGFSGAKMSGMHRQNEWHEIYSSGRLEAEIKKQCPSVKDVKDDYLNDLYEFFYKYGSDSGNVPAC